MHYRSLLAGLVLSALLQTPASAESGAFTPAQLKIQNSQALLERYLPPPIHDPLQADEPDGPPADLEADVLPGPDEPVDQPIEVIPFNGNQETVQSLELTLQSGRLTQSVAQALRRAKLPFERALQMAFQSESFPRQVETGDKLELKFAQDEEGTGLVLQGLSLTLASEPAPIRMYRFVPSDQDAAHYYDAQGYEYASRLLNSPIDYISISSFLGDGRHHKGLDLRAPVGTPVHVPFRAQVERINWYTYAQGRCVQVVYVDLGIRAKFFHLSHINDDVVPGRMLEPGEVFALSGNTGRSTGPHLHYQLEDVFSDEVLDPLEVHGFGSPRLQNSDRGYLEAQIAALETAPSAASPNQAATAQVTRESIAPAGE
jgi:murein DD-endopeptidase MepM/ murein hydrolase activator NlpD